jgi:O-antigen ligase
MGLLIMILVQNLYFGKEKIIQLSKVFRFLGIVQGLFCIFSIICWKKGNSFLQFESLLLRFLPDSLHFDIIKGSMLINIVRTDWFSGHPWPRVSGFFIYPTALGMGMIVIMLMSFLYYRSVKMNKLKVALEIGIMFIPLFFSLSRTVFVAFMFAFLIVHALSLSKGKKLYLNLSILCFLSILIVPTVFFIQEVFEFFLEAREGSTNLREKVYLLAISTALNNPILGIGVKYEVPGIEIPIGSHSSYISIFLKTGFLGLISVLTFQLTIILNWIKAKSFIKDSFQRILWKYLGVIYFSINIWMITEDIDAPQIVALFYFITCGLIVLMSNNKKFLEV